MTVDPYDVGDLMVDGLYAEIDKQEPELAARLELAAREKRYSLTTDGGTGWFTFPDEGKTIVVQVLVNVGDGGNN